MERERSFMSDEVFEAVLGYIDRFKDRNSFCPPTFIGHKDGEPLLNKRLPDRLRRIPHDMKIDIYSHGLMLPKLAARGIDFIDFLATLPNRCRYMMSYHPYNHDGSINSYADTVAYLRDRLQNPPPNVEFITVSHKSHWVTEELQKAWVASWEGLPITVHSNCSLNPWTGRIEESTVHFNGCPYGDFGHMFIGVSGNIIACCLDLEEEIVFGNVLTDDPEHMFDTLSVFYEDQRKRNVKHPVCNNCFGLPRSLQSLSLRNS